MQSVLHLIPYDTVGGVETAARAVPAQWGGGAGGVAFRRAYLVTHSAVEIFPDDWHGPEISVNHPVAHWQLLRFVLKNKPDLLIASLWRSCPTLIAFKMLRPRSKVVLFLHSAVDVHIFDRVLNRLAMLLSIEIWADSTTTLEARVPKTAHNRAKVLSFLTSRPRSLPARSEADHSQSVAPNFVFWGRLQAEKNIGFAIETFAAIHALIPNATFDIFGPDRGALAELQALVADLDLDGAVNFLGALPQDQLLERAAGYNFYLQTSLFEGMAMSVIEAMGIGLVPVVTPVGEIPSYCYDGETGIHVTSAQETAQRIAALIADAEAWHAMSTRAVAQWAEAPLYQDDFRAACDSLLSTPESKKV